MPKTINKRLLKSLMGLASVVEVRDPYTGGHLWRVGQFSKLLADKLGLDKHQIFHASIGGFLHDLGKIGVPDAILRKPDKLTDDEFSVIKMHPTMGAELLAEHPLADLVRDAVLRHHERPDGRGYPDGLIGEQAPQVAHIVGLTDAFDAMTSTRSYRKGMPIEKALSILAEEQGHQFDPKMVEAFTALHTVHGAIAHVVGHSDHGQPLVTCPMCGPIISVPRSKGAGSEVFCRNCGGLFRLHRKGNGYEPEGIGSVGSSSLLRPAPETEVFDEIADAIPAPKSAFFLGRVGAMIGLRG